MFLIRWLSCDCSWHWGGRDPPSLVSWVIYQTFSGDAAVVHSCASERQFHNDFQLLCWGSIIVHNYCQIPIDWSKKASPWSTGFWVMCTITKFYLVLVDISGKVHKHSLIERTRQISSSRRHEASFPRSSGTLGTKSFLSAVRGLEHVSARYTDPFIVSAHTVIPNPGDLKFRHY